MLAKEHCKNVNDCKKRSSEISVIPARTFCYLNAWSGYLNQGQKCVFLASFLLHFASKKAIIKYALQEKIMKLVDNLGFDYIY